MEKANADSLSEKIREQELSTLLLASRFPAASFGMKKRPCASKACKAGRRAHPADMHRAFLLLGPPLVAAVEHPGPFNP